MPETNIWIQYGSQLIMAIISVLFVLVPLTAVLGWLDASKNLKATKAGQKISWKHYYSKFTIGLVILCLALLIALPIIFFGAGWLASNS